MFCFYCFQAFGCFVIDVQNGYLAKIFIIGYTIVEIRMGFSRMIYVAVITLLCNPLLPMMTLKVPGSYSDIAAQEVDPSEDNVLFSGIDGYFQEYHTYDTMVMELNKLQNMYPDLVKIYDLTEKSDLRHTYEGRSVLGVKVSSGVRNEQDYFDDPDKENVLLFGAHHAREWMSYEVCIYTIYYLAMNYGLENMDNDGDGLINEDLMNGLDEDGDGLTDEDPSEGRISYLLDNREIWIIPMLNPDGVMYDHTISEPGSGGGWRKNVRDNNQNNQFDPSWDGVDLNRNYPYLWWYNRETLVRMDGVVMTQDSANPRSDMYRGPSDTHNQDGDFGPGGIIPRINEDPVDSEDNDGDGKVDEDRDGGFTEPETQALGRLVKTYDDQGDTGNIPFAASISYHSVASLILWPWGWTRNEAPHSLLFQEVGGKMGDIMDYEAEQASYLYPTSGDSEDWLYACGNVIAFTIELEGQDGGFHPATKHIAPICKKALKANLYLSDQAEKIEVARNYYQPIENSIADINVVERPAVIRANEGFRITAEVEDIEKMIPETLTFHYSSDGEAYRTAPMLLDNSSGNYYYSIEFLEPQTDIYYYITAKDISGITLSAPDYGSYDPYITHVSPEIGLTSMENVMMFIMMGLILILVWGGFVGLLNKAMKAEKLKSSSE